MLAADEGSLDFKWLQMGATSRATSRLIPSLAFLVSRAGCFESDFQPRILHQSVQKLQKRRHRLVVI